MHREQKLMFSYVRNEVFLMQVIMRRQLLQLLVIACCGGGLTRKTKE